MGDWATSSPIDRSVHATIQDLAGAKGWSVLLKTKKAGHGKLIIGPKTLAEIRAALAAK